MVVVIIQLCSLSKFIQQYIVRMSIYVELSHSAAQQRLAQHCKSTILQLKIKQKFKRNQYIEKDEF